ncbi:MAG: DDE-type integrase/transposase/recombinase, partial [Rhodovibrionaceae bacterium]
FLVRPRRCAKSARRLLRKLLKKQGFAPKRITTDKLKSYAVAIRKERVTAIHDQGLRANNRAENSHQPCGDASENSSGLQRLLRPAPSLARRFFKQFRADAFVV